MRQLRLLALFGTSYLIILGAEYGPRIGIAMPVFEATDQDGKQHTLKDILGPNGAALVFFRSADW